MMLTFIEELPTDKRIAGAHCVPLLTNGDIVMVWDRDEQVLTTIGGRLENNESVIEGLRREAMEEAGLHITDEITPFAAWYWKQTDTYTVFFLAAVDKFAVMPDGFEKTGYVIMNFETALEIIKKVEGDGERIDTIRRAGVLSGRLKVERSVG